MQDFTLHTHTIGFDGQNSADEMIIAARDAGFKTIGISNHFIVHPAIKKSPMYNAAFLRGYDAIYSDSFDETLNKFIMHYDELNRLGDKYGIRVLRGMEVDYFHNDEWRRGFDHAVKILRPDYLIGSTHFVFYNDVLCNSHDMQHAAPGDQARMFGLYWENLRNAARSGMFSWLAHLDLPKKVGLRQDAPQFADCEYAQDTIDIIAQTQSRIEINTTPFQKMGEPYPSPAILKMVAAKNIPVLFSDDAHQATHIGRDFAAAKKMATECGITCFVELNDIVRQK